MSKAACQRKYLREQTVVADEAQMTFGKNGDVAARKRVKVESQTINTQKLVFCPFCLEGNIVQKFLVSTKKGISQSKALCPECHTGMLLRTLLRKWTVEDYARWVFDYRRSGFWQKVKEGAGFDKFNKNLKEKDWLQPFWDHYKALKGEATATGEDESYVDYMNRQGEEAAKEWAHEKPRGPDY